MEEHAEQWLAETERIIDLVQHEFIHLNEKQIYYKIHVSHCNIHQIMHHLILTNNYFIGCIERALPNAKSTGPSGKYHPGYIVKYILKRNAITRCNPKSLTDQRADLWERSSGSLFLKIIEQQIRIKELITLCKTMDMNRRVVPFQLFGVIKLSIGETFEFLIHHQKSHFIVARHMMVLQQV